LVSWLLRLLQAARLGAELGLRPEPGTVALAHREAARAGEPAGERQLAELRQIMAGPDPLRGLALMDELDRRGALRFGALFHDLGKPATRGAVGEIVSFIGHDRVGAELIGGICTRLRASSRLRRHLQDLALHHLRLGFLVHQRPLARRVVYEYLRDTEPVSVDVTLLTVADRLATRGSGRLAARR